MTREFTALELAHACAEQMLADDHSSQHLGTQMRILEPGVAEMRMTVRPTMVNGHNVCHGGYIFTLADSAFAFACNCYDDVTVAAGASIDFIVMAQLGDELTAVAREVHRGRRTGVYQVDVRNQDQQLVAVFRGRSASLGKPILKSK